MKPADRHQLQPGLSAEPVTEPLRLFQRGSYADWSNGDAIDAMERSTGHARPAPCSCNGAATVANRAALALPDPIER
jgi:hypothetical protein